MRKIFFALIVTLACLTTNSPSVTAQDVWISSGGNGFEWYILDETIEGDGTGKFRWANVDTKLVADDGSCIGVEWKFTQIKPDGGRHTPFFANYRPQFYFRTTDVTGVVSDLKDTNGNAAEMCMPGDHIEMTVELITPIAIEKGLLFAIREGGHTVGSGRVIEILEA